MIGVDSESNDPLEFAVCWSCRYPIRGLTINICPECGNRFDVDDPTTYRDIRTAGIRYLLATPPAGWHLVGMTVIGAYAIVAASEPGTGPIEFLFINCMALPFIVVCIVNYIVHVAACIFAPPESDTPERSALRARWWRWIVTPTILVVLGTLIAYRWPL